ncbi:hypothetical protein J437_LFUL010223 [Ladona fulva]|uniref:BPTI/Kunitz inhibitor domain-containing protein n=1 Tax=Ladona fulva TaxID=123851 RepID=A0A8K0K8P8_LADFU|nr:hypothetical protein J437_LFUL010223 [Ladona fulva]
MEGLFHGRVGFLKECDKKFKVEVRGGYGMEVVLEWLCLKGLNRIEVVGWQKDIESEKGRWGSKERLSEGVEKVESRGAEDGALLEEETTAFNPQTDCFLPKDPGPCRGFFRAVYYSPETRRCENFVYSGCGGNKNR